MFCVDFIFNPFDVECHIQFGGLLQPQLSLQRIHVTANIIFLIFFKNCWSFNQKWTFSYGAKCDNYYSLSMKLIEDLFLLYFDMQIYVFWCIKIKTNYFMSWLIICFHTCWRADYYNNDQLFLTFNERFLKRRVILFDVIKNARLPV